LALSANVASGDDDADDRRLGTFNPINPNLNYFEEAAILAPQNFFNIEPEISWVITPRLGMALDWNFFWRLEENDAVYVRGLNPLPGTAGVKGRRVAHTPSISIDYQWSRQIKLDLSYSHFFARTVIRNADGKDISFLKLQMQWTF
jgi:outer membrane receptor protein involved in Fe transport